MNTVDFITLKSITLSISSPTHPLLLITISLSRSHHHHLPPQLPLPPPPLPFLLQSALVNADDQQAKISVSDLRKRFERGPGAPSPRSSTKSTNHDTGPGKGLAPPSSTKKHHHHRTSTTSHQKFASPAPRAVTTTNTSNSGSNSSRSGSGGGAADVSLLSPTGQSPLPLPIMSPVRHQSSLLTHHSPLIPITHQASVITSQSLSITHHIIITSQLQ